MNNHRLILFLIMFFVFITASSPAMATDVSGTISSDETWTLANSPYVVTSNLLVEVDVTLTIDPGVVVQFSGNYAILIEGILLASGTSADPITFTSGDSNPSAGDWSYLLLSASSSKNKADTHKMEHCIVEYGGGYDDDYGTVRITEGAKALISNCTIRNNSSQGIYAYRGGNITIKNSIIEGNFAQSGAGIYVLGYEGNKTEITGCTIQDNQADYYGGGICIEGYYSNVDINQCIITKNTADDGGGIFAETDETLTVSENLIYKNTATDYGGGAYLYYGIVSAFEGNLVYGNEASKGGGLFLCFFTGNIINNTIVENKAESGGGIHVTSYNYYDITSLSGNSIIRNVASGTSYDYGGGIYAEYLGKTDVDNNTIVGNESKSFGDSGAIYLYDSYYSTHEITHLNGNNIYGNSGIDLYSQIDYDSNHIDATNCFWGTTDKDTIDDMIYDFFDDPTLEVIEYEPFLSKMNPAAPPAPPENLTLTELKSGSILLSWDAVAVSDLAGYKIYYGENSNYPFEGTGLTQGNSPIDAGNVTELSLSGLDTESVYYFAVSAYDDGSNPGPVAVEGWVSKRVKYDTGDDDDSSDDDSDDDSSSDDDIPVGDDDSLSPRSDDEEAKCCG